MAAEEEEWRFTNKTEVVSIGASGKKRGCTARRTVDSDPKKSIVHIILTEHPNVPISNDNRIHLHAYNVAGYLKKLILCIHTLNFMPCRSRRLAG